MPMPQPLPGPTPHGEQDGSDSDHLLNVPQRRLDHDERADKGKGKQAKEPKQESSAAAATGDEARKRAQEAAQVVRKKTPKVTLAQGIKRVLVRFKARKEEAANNDDVGEAARMLADFISEGPVGVEELAWAAKGLAKGAKAKGAGTKGAGKAKMPGKMGPPVPQQAMKKRTGAACSPLFCGTAGDLGTFLKRWSPWATSSTESKNGLNYNT